MNRIVMMTLAFVAVAALVRAQGEAEKAAGMELPNPKHQEHEALAKLVGEWELSMKMQAMPGVPGMEEAIESQGIERAELVCNGLWLKSVVNATHKGQPFHGIWLAGYDPFKKIYTSYWVSSDPNENGWATMDGSYDAAADTWGWKGLSPAGEMRSAFVMSGPDASIESCFMKTPDGKEVKFMEITRKRRAKDASAASAAAAADSTAPEHVELRRGVGTWDAVVKAAPPGQPVTEEKGTEVVYSVCGGRWIWSDFKGQMMGMPFEGHAVVGWDPAKKKYVSLWIDSMSATAAELAGDYDAAKKVFTSSGKCVCPLGKPMTMSETAAWKDENTRVMEMSFEQDGVASKMEIVYRRRAAK